jgi:hypothetical protein
MVSVELLFVDALYVLGDAANAACGTRYRGCVSWDYAGLIQLPTAISRDRTGLPVVLCYWYDATIGGRRAAEHDTLADIPGLKLRLGRTRPGGREGAEPGRHDEHQQNGCHVDRSLATSNGQGQVRAGCRRAARGRRRATVGQVRNSRRWWCRTGKLGRGHQGSCWRWRPVSKRGPSGQGV